MATFDIAGNVFLSAAAAALAPDDLAAWTEVAEDALSLANRAFSNDGTARAENLLARQISAWQDLGLTLGYLTSETRGPQSRTYRTGTTGGAPLPVDPIVAAGVQRLLRDEVGYPQRTVT